MRGQLGGAAIFALAAIGGLVALAVTWALAGGTPIAAKQVPLLISGGLGGLALMIAGATLVSALAERPLHEARRHAQERTIANLSALVSDLQDRR